MNIEHAFGKKLKKIEQTLRELETAFVEKNNKIEQKLSRNCHEH